MDQFEVKRSDSFPFMFQIYRKNGRLIPNALKGWFTNKEDGERFLANYLLEKNTYGDASTASTG